MKIQVLGPGCANCAKMETHAREAIASLGDAASSYEIEKITDSDVMAEMGLLVTPGLAIDGVLKSSGKVLSPEEIKSFIS
ncbi:MAG: thioredoxin family protein [Spirochaetaceae bacterium]|nr:MAG: thioredoxin family protein [Spirochaetaceae bacterium]